MRVYILLLVFLSIQLIAMDEIVVNNEIPQVNPNDAVISIPKRRIVRAKRRLPSTTTSVPNVSAIDDQTWNNMTPDEKLDYYLVCFGMKKSTVFCSVSVSCACAVIGLWICAQLRDMI